MKFMLDKKITATILSVGVLIVLGCTVKPRQAIQSSQADEPHDLTIWPSIESSVIKDESVEQRIKSILSNMTLKQKVGQMLQPELKNITLEDIKKYHVGSVLNGGGAFPNNKKDASVADWVELADAYYRASMDSDGGGIAIPILWGTDAVHGHNNVMGAILFPHNIGLGASRNPDLVEAIAAATAKEVAVTGIDWAFAPTVAVVRNDRWGRSYEGYSEDPEIIFSYAGKAVEGLQGDVEDKTLFSPGRVVATIKHFVGDGGTVEGIDRGDNKASEQVLFDIHAQGYVSGLEAGAQTVMASFNSWKGDKLHGNRYLLTEVLKQRMGFDGFVVGDWNGHSYIPGCSTTDCPAAINAGVDMLMSPDPDWKVLYRNIVKQVKSGEIAEGRIDDAVSRILRVKIRAGLFEAGTPSSRPLAGKTALLGSKSHRAIARQAVRESLVLLKNKQQLLPLNPASKVLVAGDGADNIAKQSGGWTLTWQGTENNNSDFPNAESIFSGIEKAVAAAGGQAELNVHGDYQQRPDVAIVVYGENPYAEMQGDIENLDYHSSDNRDLALLNKLKKEGIPVVSVFLSGRPMWVNPELNASDAFVAAWLPGSEGGGIADVIFSPSKGQEAYNFTGKLSFSWPNHPEQSQLNRYDDNYEPLFPYGYGLNLQDIDTLGDNLEQNSSLKKDKLLAEDKTLFASRAKPPWQMFIGEQDNWMVPVGGRAVTSGQFNAVSIVPINKDVQEDARKLSWSGTTAGHWLLHDTDQAHDLSQLLKSNGVLQLDLKVNELPSSTVIATMDCNKACQGEVDITKALKRLIPGVWATFAIDLDCFAQAGAKLSEITSPLKLSTGGSLSLSLANIKIQAEPSIGSNVQCSDFIPSS